MLSLVAPQPSPAMSESSPAAIYSIMTPPPQRLQSPIRLDARLRSSLCSPPHRRRSVRPPRRRHCARADCHIESALHPFDRLPWISAMNISPDALDPMDIADLSQLVVDDPPPQCGAVAPGSGPIRRRKTSLRSNPLAPKGLTLHETTPYTPLSHINHSRIHFHNLMPVFSCDHNARS
ncbi:hypothetical protein DFH07DRAFT_1064177 [Mycena maculata]|uniref:Uncharacterized protein n=1 Tax=Mycena maculata TaxID=230809 RepID=A0AAD7N056_9AGAR|nr:hypothetical protein DFH07DRAFT_1064177 [Mycena maculata]